MKQKLAKLIILNNRLEKLGNTRQNITIPNIYISPDAKYMNVLLNLLSALINECKTQMQINNTDKAEKVREEYYKYVEMVEQMKLEEIHNEYEKNKQLNQKLVYISDDKLVKLMDRMNESGIVCESGFYDDVFTFEDGEINTRMYNFIKKNIE